jgi:AAA+ ATPase superfamily predicted ATPase
LTALEALERMAESGDLPVNPVRFGRWWDRTAEIDGVALGEKASLFCEVKWSDGVDAPSLVRGLEAKAPLTGLKGARHYAVVARSFRHRAPGALCLDLEDLGRLFRASPAPHP